MEFGIFNTMSIILFIVILAVLILVHELGHFIAARSVGARVDEFGIGFPPRAWAFRPRGSETEYSVNWIPFGGFVKILGENGEEDPPAGGSSEDVSRSLTSKNRLAQVWVLSAGVIFNVLFAWVLISSALMIGAPMSVTPETRGLVGEPGITILQVFSEAPAEIAGLEPGDVVRELSTVDGRVLVPHTVEALQDFIAESAGIPLDVVYERGGESFVTNITPAINDAQRGVIGVSLDMVGVVQLGPIAALAEGGRTTFYLTHAVAKGLGGFVADAVRGVADYSQISGPVGIVGLVGGAAERGIIALLSFTAIISLNLAIINLVPFPALDGGRILFVAIEGVIRRRLPAVFTQWANIVGFFALILLMVVITVSDVIKLF